MAPHTPCGLSAAIWMIVTLYDNHERYFQSTCTDRENHQLHSILKSNRMGKIFIYSPRIPSLSLQPCIWPNQGGCMAEFKKESKLFQILLCGFLMVEHQYRQTPLALCEN